MKNLTEIPDEVLGIIEHERAKAENFRIAAWLGYGALLAHNKDGQFTFVLEAMDKVLNPKLFTPDS